METAYCRGCGMPLTRPEDYDTGFCLHCYKDGSPAQNTEMEKMIDHCMRHLGEMNRHRHRRRTKCPPTE